MAKKSLYFERKRQEEETLRIEEQVGAILDFEYGESEYYDSKILLLILENIIGKKFAVIKSDINELKICVTENEIKNYLDNLFKNEFPESYTRMQSKLYKRLEWELAKGTVFWNNYRESRDRTRPEVVEIIDNECGDWLKSFKYRFEPFTLEYYIRYVEIVKDKSISILNIIEKISNNQHNDIESLLNDLDISLDELGNISRKDIIRLASPLILNYNVLIEKTSEGNNLSTYLERKLSEEELIRTNMYTRIFPFSLFYTDWNFNAPGSIKISPECERKLQRNGKILQKVK